MHNKLLIADDSIALVGGRNIGNQYFQMDPASQVADDDVFSAGPIAQQLSATFDEYWNSRFAIPARALAPATHRPGKLTNHQWRQRRRHQMRTLASPGIDYTAKIDSGDPYADMVSGRLPFVWATATVICDSPEKKLVRSGERSGRLMERAVAVAAGNVRSEMLVITPYLVPAPDEMKLLADMRRRGVTIRILTKLARIGACALAPVRLHALSHPAARGGSPNLRATRTPRQYQGQRPNQADIALRQLFPAREAVRLRPQERVLRLDEFRPKVAAFEHRSRRDHRQSGTRRRDHDAFRRHGDA